MGFLDKLFDSFSSMIDPDEPPTPPKPNAPDFASYWKQYKGWINNINDRNTGELANVRARLSAAGASPDLLMMQTEQLESQRKSEIASLEGGQTKRFLDEAFDIATGKRENPYSSALPGMELDENGAVSKSAEAGSVDEYFTKFFGPVGSEPADAGAEAAKRAKMAAGGAASGDAAPGGGTSDTSGTTMSSVFGTQDDTFWR